jgi:asparagine synthase (glutamine-hydrolysing)
MCGIAGKLVFDPMAHVSENEIRRMLAPMAHRGPDGNGVHLDRNVGLGHCRLSIIDLEGGTQPMANEDETVWIVFNGEIYNFPELRARLLAKGHVFRSRSDTEVILHLYEDLGADCVKELRGMFAFAIWDSKRQRLFIARDRVGIKPLYYCQTDKAFLFASELKAFLSAPDVSREINHNAIRIFLSFNYLPGAETLFKSVHKLLPGHWLSIENGRTTTKQYWDLQFTRDRWNQSFEDTVEELYSLLKSTVRDHMIADVPVGVLLSGGVDSSAVLSFAVEGTDKKVSAFTVGFDGGDVVDERPYARMAAKKFGAEHHEISITEDDFWNFLPAYVRHMEEPVCEPPAVALFYVSKLARNHVKVVLSGEGGDEAFAGYPNYPNMMRLDNIRSIAGPLAGSMGSLTQFAGNIVGDDRLQRYGYALGRSLGEHYFSRTSGPTAFFNRQAKIFFTSDFLESASPNAPMKRVNELLGALNGESLLNRMLYVDTKTWLPDDLLVKADKMTMANSLELRVPLLDHKVLEFAASLPPEFKVKGKQTKRVLKAAFAKALPQEILNRKKAGFPVPYGKWLRNGLSHQVRDVLLSAGSTQRGYFQKKEINRLLDANAHTGNYSKEMFSLLVLELWHREFADTAPVENNPSQGASIKRGSRCEVY